MVATTLDNTLGVLVLSSFPSSVLYGVIVVQLYLYVTRGSRDPLWLRILVWTVWMLETAHVVVHWILVYKLTVTQYGDPEAITNNTTLMSIPFPLMVILGAMVYSFFAYRIRMLSGHNTIPIIMWCGVLAKTAFGFATCAIIAQSATMERVVDHFIWLGLTPLGINVAMDVLNTLSLCSLLCEHSGQGSGSKNMIDKLIRYTVETGSTMSFFGLAALITAVVMPKTYVYYGIILIYPRLFSNSLLASLNARQGLREAQPSRTDIWTISDGFIQPSREFTSEAGETVNLELPSSESRSAKPADIPMHRFSEHYPHSK
ncbi:hypothetical protein K439DRAFT_1631574 [Ramaria rubella]|nr:hypothetical protein K439DRAFT_1631574 [Ramaria rubella]